MDKEPLLEIVYTNSANSHALAIKRYLLYKFTPKEIENFYKLLRIFEGVVAAFPELYPKSTANKMLHRAVLSKPLSVFYKVHKNYISNNSDTG